MLFDKTHDFPATDESERILLPAYRGEMLVSGNFASIWRRYANKANKAQAGLNVLIKRFEEIG